jgi:hypothetical protein
MSKPVGLLVVIHQFLLDTLPSCEVETSGRVTIGDKFTVKVCQVVTKHGVLLPLIRATVVQAKHGVLLPNGVQAGEVGGHLELELLDKAVYTQALR